MGMASTVSAAQQDSDLYPPYVTYDREPLVIGDYRPAGEANMCLEVPQLEDLHIYTHFQSWFSRFFSGCSWGVHPVTGDITIASPREGTKYKMLNFSPGEVIIKRGRGVYDGMVKESFTDKYEEVLTPNQLRG